MPLFSIIIPTRNRASLLQQCIESVISQTYQDYELIIIDDGSTDTTEQMVTMISDQRIKYFKQQHQERSQARNLGISLAEGRYICFVDDDDLLLQDYLQDFHNYLLAHDYKDVILRTGYQELKGETKKRMALYQKHKHKNPVNFAAYNMCGVWSLAIPSKFLIKDQFPTSFPHWQDTHLILRLFAQYPFVQLNNHNYIYRKHETSGSLKDDGATAFHARAEINVAAIKDLFTSQKELLSHFLPTQTLAFLKAEKYIQYAVNAKKIGYQKIANDLYKKSKEEKIDRRLWKYYISFLLS